MSVERKEMGVNDRASREMDREKDRELEEVEKKLRIAMQHREAPLGLKQRVLALSRERTRERRQTQRQRVWMWQRIAASVVLAAAIGGFAVYRQVEERALEQK